MLLYILSLSQLSFFIYIRLCFKLYLSRKAVLLPPFQRNHPLFPPRFFFAKAKSAQKGGRHGLPQCRAFRKIYSACNRLFRRSFFISARAPSSFCHNKNPRVSTRGISFSGGSPQYCRQRASRAYDDPAVMRLLIAARKRAFPVLIFLCPWFRSPLYCCPLFLLPCLLFCYPCFFLLFCLLFCSFLFIGKAFLNPADYPRGFIIQQKKPPLRAAESRFTIISLQRDFP